MVDVATESASSSNRRRLGRRNSLPDPSELAVAQEKKKEKRRNCTDLKKPDSEAVPTKPTRTSKISETLATKLRNYKLIASSKLVRQCSDPLLPGHSSPPPPAPLDPHQERQTNFLINPLFKHEPSRPQQQSTYDYLQYERNSGSLEAVPFLPEYISLPPAFPEPRQEKKPNVSIKPIFKHETSRPILESTFDILQYRRNSESLEAVLCLPKLVSLSPPASAEAHQESKKNVVINQLFEYEHSRPMAESREAEGYIRIPQPTSRENRRPRYRSPRTFLDLSPGSHEDFEEAKLHQLPNEYFRRPVEERFLERCPPPVRQLDYNVRPRVNLTPSPRPRQRSRSPPSASRYPAAGSSRSPKSSQILDPMGRMNPLEDHERKIIIEFCHLLEKSKQLFNGLRELPQYGHKQWHSYFGRTFDVYTKLWKFQQQHRAILDSKYGLKRWQIGEIASKIGQLYYHFYLRTSETAYLNEAYSFYFAIRGRSYYTQACKEDKCELMVKKLRYYARFIVACLLLKKGKLVKDLIKELDKQIIEYGNAYEPDDQNEWRIVADEVRAFIKAEPVVSVIHPDDYAVILSHRLSAQSTPPVERSPVMNLTLQEVLIVGSNSAQVKFSELTMDMFRMMQTLEREPTADVQHMYDESPRQRYISTPSAVNNKGYNLDCSTNRGESPHKYLLFKPSPNQIFVYLASACDDLQMNGAVLLYISAEGLIVPPLKHTEDAGGYDVGGLITTSKTDIVFRETTKDGKTVLPKHKELQVLHPGDLYPFTRRPMFLIVDSDNSFIFHDLPRFFGQPLIILMSPLEQPSSLHPTSGDKRAEGSLFTLFLHCPLSAFCYCCDIKTMSLTHWERAQTYIDAYLAEASQLLTRSRIDAMYMAFMGDDFLRLLILRFIFCETFLRMHRLFRGRTQRTRASPPLPDDLYEHSSLTHIVIDLASHLQVRGHFHDPSAVAPSQPSNRE